MSEEDTKYPLPSTQCLQHAVKLAIVDDRPIVMDYWTDSCDKKVIIGVRENNDKLLVKNEDEYTSHVMKIYNVEEEYIVLTENSIYIIKSDVDTKRIS